MQTAKLLLAAAFAGLCAVLVLLWKAWWSGVGFSWGSTVVTQDTSASRHLLVIAAVVAFVASLVGVVAGVRVKSTASVVVMGMVLVVAVAAGLATLTF